MPTDPNRYFVLVSQNGGEIRENVPSRAFAIRLAQQVRDRGHTAVVHWERWEDGGWVSRPIAECDELVNYFDRFKSNSEASSDTAQRFALAWLQEFGDPKDNDDLFRACSSLASTIQDAINEWEQQNPNFTTTQNF